MISWFRATRPPVAVRGRLCAERLEDRDLPSTVALAAPPYTPAQVRHAYGFDQVNADGAGETIAIVDAFYDLAIKSDLAGFSSQFGLPQLDGKNGDGTFTQLDLSNKTQSPSGDDWTMETALDVEWAHAIAPRANILLVEAASDQLTRTGVPADLLSAVDTARNTPGVVVVSMSWGLSEWAGETSLDSHFQTPAGHARITFVAASGDNGAPPNWPAISPNVVGVGGTTLRLSAATGAVVSETAWGNGVASSSLGGSGGGFSQFEAKPAFQATVTQSGVHRTGPDLSFDADPSTGFYVLNSARGRWFQAGGTSAGTPQIAALVALADQLRGQARLGSLDGVSQTLPALYAAPAGDYRDIVQGNNRYPAVPGYDLVTGRGSPLANLLVPYLASFTAPATTTTAVHATIIGTPPSSAVVSRVTSSRFGLSSRQGQPQAFAPDFGGPAHRRFTCPCEPSA
jgi:subtilase family serine protease